MLYNEFQYWPLSLRGWFPSSPNPIDFDEAIPLLDSPSAIVIEGYNLDDTYSHTVWVGMNVMREHLTTEMIGFLSDLGLRG